jgi:glycosyltransferase involved in cell wall biosynthesis
VLHSVLLGSGWQRLQGKTNLLIYFRMDWKFYVTYYKDLNNLTTEKQAINHWNQYGQKENRICSANKRDIRTDYKNIYLLAYSTYRTPTLNTGVQRVVRLLTKHLNPISNLFLIDFNMKNQEFMPLTTEHMESLRNFNGTDINRTVTFDLPNKYLLLTESIGHMHTIIEKARRMNMKIVSIFYDDIPFRIYGNQKFAEYIHDILKGDIILPISKYSTDCINLYKQNNNIKIITCLLPGEFPGKQRILDYTVNTKKNYILCVSQITRRKNQVNLIKAFKQLQHADTELILVAGNNYDQAYTNEILAECNKNVSLKLHISDDELNNYYMDARFTVFPSTDEGFGLPILESLWYCKPCICMNTGAMNEIGTAGCLKIDCNNVNDLAAAMNTLLTDDTVLNKLVAEITSSKIRTWHDYAKDILKNLE